jgi:hypothetical protein
MKQFVISENIRNYIVNVLNDAIHPTVSHKAITQIISMMQRLPEFTPAPKSSEESAPQEQVDGN